MKNRNWLDCKVLTCKVNMIIVEWSRSSATMNWTIITYRQTDRQR